MTDTLKIEFGAPDDDTCVVTVDRVVAAGSPAYFGSAAEADGNPLAQKLLEITELEAVLLQDQTVTLLKPVDGAPWTGIQPRVEEILRTHFAQLSETSARAEREMTPDEKQVFVKVQNVLNVEVNPLVASHGGFIEVLDLKEETVYIHMSGGCQGCGMASVTLKQGVERAILEHVPEVQEVLDTTDHASGQNPYYAASS